MVSVYEMARNEVVALWPKVEPWLQKAFDICDVEYTLDQLKAMLVSGNQVLLVAVDEQGEVTGVASVSALLFPNETVAFITAMAGNTVTNDEVYSQLRAWAKSRHFTCIRGCVRESVARLYRQLGFQEKYRVIEAKL